MRIKNKYRRLYVQSALSIGSTLQLNAEQTHYVKNVLRCSSKDKLAVFNQQDGEFLAGIVLEKNHLLLVVEQFLRFAPKMENLHLGICMVKNVAMSEIVDKATQLGATSIVPIISQYTNLAEFNKSRYEKIAGEATEQSDRCDQMTIYEPVKLQDFVNMNADLIIWADERQQDQTVADIKLWPNNISVLIGPEGGFSPIEQEFLQEKAYSVCLGRHILKSQTACIALLAQITLLRKSKWARI